MNTLFNPYGFLVGIGIITALQLSELQAKKHHFSDKELWRVATWMLIGGVIGARLYHVFSDFELYQSHLFQIFAVWEGGLSIIGGVAGALIGLLGYCRQKKKNVSFVKTVADLAVFGLPFGQAIGRLGNFFNQELYGFPTQLPWGIFIDLPHRLPGFEIYQKFHPLFFYEMMGTVLIGAFLWWVERKKIWKVGSGQFALFYIMAYSALRFALDFLRIDKQLSSFFNLGINQLILVGVVLVSGVLWMYQDEKK